MQRTFIGKIWTSDKDEEMQHFAQFLKQFKTDKNYEVKIKELKINGVQPHANKIKTAVAKET